MFRIDYFRQRAGQPRFWWFRRNDYLPWIYTNLDPAWDEGDVLYDWFEETERAQLIGECNVPMMSALLGLIEGNGIGRIVQLGHYAGYSTLLLGYALRRMDKVNGLFSLDIDAEVTAFARDFVRRACLQPYVQLEVGSSERETVRAAALEYLAGPPQLVIIDSSHEYEHTLKELESWWPVLEPGGFVFLHDVSEQARAYDATGKGGVRWALNEWMTSHGYRGLITIEAGAGYQDGCGLGIIQK